MGRAAVKESLKPRKIPQQARSIRTREEILEATARLLNSYPLEEVSTNHIARKTGISVGTLYKYYPNKDAILTDLSLEYMRQDAELFAGIFARCKGRQPHELIDETVEALLEVHRKEARVRGVVYQNLERLRLVGEAEKTRRKIQEQGVSVFPDVNPAQMWVVMTTISSVVFSVSQLPSQHRDWEFARELCRRVLSSLLMPKS